MAEIKSTSVYFCYSFTPQIKILEYILFISGRYPFNLLLAS